MNFASTLTANAFYRIGNVLVLFLITVLLTRLMGVSGYGLLSLLIVNVTLFNLFTSLGIDAGITYHMASHPSKAKGVLGIILLVLAGQLMLLVLTEFGSYYLNGHFLLYRSEDRSLWWMALLYLTGISLQEKYGSLLNGSHRYTAYNRWVFIGNLASLVIFTIVFLQGEDNVHSFYIGLYVLCNFLQALLLVFVFHHQAGPVFRGSHLDRTGFRGFFSYSFFAFLINLIQFLAYRIDFWLLDYYRGEKELGWYALAVRIVQLYWILPVLYASIVFPKVASSQQDYDQHKMMALLRMVNTANLGVLLMLLFLLKPLAISLFGVAFGPSVRAAMILLPGVVLFCNTTILAAYFAGINRLRVNFIGSLICFLSILFLDLMLIPANGFTGAAVASSIGYAVTTLYFVVIYCRENRQPIRQIFLIQKSDWLFLNSWTKSIFTKNQ